jgi:heavy metal translocating P-type ATPase
VELDWAAVVGAWWRIGVAAVVAGQSMVFGLAVNLTPPEGAAYWLVHGVLLAAALAVCALLLPPMVGEAWRAVRARRVSVEMLFLITLVGALGASLTATLTHSGAVYYEVVAILLAVYSAGKTLGARSRAKALRAVDDTRERFDQATRRDGSRCTVAELSVGDVVRAAPGGAIGVDGLVRSGSSFVQETAMTGEWRPRLCEPGAAVWAGTHVIDGELEIEVRAPAGRRRLDAVLETVAAARLAPSGLQRQADRLSAAFLPLVVLVSAGTFAFWCWRSGWVAGLFNSMAVLLVACPCALGLATPLAVWQGLVRLAGLGLVARTGDVLDILARADHVCFDKTGTLTEARIVVTGWMIEPEFAGEAAWLREAVAAVERGLDHPVARALAAATPSASGPAEGRRIVPGCGVEGRVDGREVRVGSARWLGSDSEIGDGCILVQVGGRRAARIEFGEDWRAGVAEALAELRVLGVAGEVLTGDASWTAAELHGVPVFAGLMPAEKTARVEELRRSGRVVVFVGDGINDSAAMSAADGAIAMHGGSGLAQASAPAVFLGDDLRFLPAAIRTARQIRRGVAGNLRFAAAYNALGMAFAAAGLLHPVGAALLMLGSSAFVAVRALRSGAKAM